MMEKNDTLPEKYDVNAKWDAFLDLTVCRFVYSSLAGAFSGLLLFMSLVTRWVSVAFGAGVGVGSAYIESSHIFNGSPGKLETPKRKSNESCKTHLMLNLTPQHQKTFPIGVKNTF